MGDRELVTAADEVGGGEGGAAADSGAESWVAEFEARLEAQERAWRRRRWWGWVRMGVGNWVVADVGVVIFYFPMLITMFSSNGPPSPITLLNVVSGPESITLVGLVGLMMLPGAIIVWLLALGLSYANLRVRRVVARNR